MEGMIVSINDDEQPHGKESFAPSAGRPAKKN